MLCGVDGYVLWLLVTSRWLVCVVVNIVDMVLRVMLVVVLRGFVCACLGFGVLGLFGFNWLVCLPAVFVAMLLV